MRAHAIVIGIDQYPKSEWCLTGAVRDAVKFARWAVTEGGVDPADLTLLLSPLASDPPLDDATLAARVQPATWKTIATTLHDYRRRGAGKSADRLWFYYAGHGVAPPGDSPADGPLLIPADTDDLDFYVQNQRIGMETFRSDMQDQPPSEQFYFVDACRDVVSLSGNKMLTQQIVWDVRGTDDADLATQAVFLSTTAGQRAKEVRGEGLFGRVLLAALRGLGPQLDQPKVPGARTRLLFNDLVEFVRSAVSDELKELPSADDTARKAIPFARTSRITGDITVAEFDAARLPKAKIRTVVGPAQALANARIEFLRWDDETSTFVPRTANPAPAGPPLSEETEFEVRGGTHNVRVEADGFKTADRPIVVYQDGKRYRIKLETLPEPAPAAPISVKRSGTFGGMDAALESVGAPAFEPEPVPATGTIHVWCPDRFARLAIYDGGGNEKVRGYASVRAENLTPGPYKVTAELTAADRVERRFTVDAGETVREEIQIGAGSLAPTVSRAMHVFDIGHHDGYAHPSENFGNLANLKLASLLAYAAWGVRWPEDRGFHHLRGIGVDPLPNLTVADSALQVLVGDARAEGACRAHVDDRELALTPLPRFPQASQGSAVLDAGPHRVRVEMPGFVAASFATSLLPGFVTVLVVTREDDGDVDVQQHLDPIEPLHRAIEDDVRYVDLAIRALENRDPLDSVEFRDFIEGQRTNPMLGVLAGYRMSGTKRADEFRGCVRPVRVARTHAVTRFASAPPGLRNRQLVTTSGTNPEPCHPIRVA